MSLVLIVDDEKNMRRVVSAHLQKAGHDTCEAADGPSAIQALEHEKPDCVISDLRMPGMSGLELLSKILLIDKDLPIVILTAHGAVETAVQAIKLGAFDYLEKPFDKDHLNAVVARALRARELSQKEPSGSMSAVTSRNEQMQALLDMVDRVAVSPTTVLITGESGTGKELVARRLHEQSDRAKRAYIRINCAAIPSGLVESELFGHEKGAFTGAVSSKPGRFELADKGTLFLDEVGSIPLETQVKLLRAIQEQEFERVGSVRTTKVNVRLIAATNVDLTQELSNGNFRQDLYYRLNVVHLRIPPLRDRIEDIKDLVGAFIFRFNRKLSRNIQGISPQAMARLRGYKWPGNIRELENAIERAVLLSRGDEITEEDLPEEIMASSSRPPAPTEPRLGDLKEASRQAAGRVEIDMIVSALKKTGGNVTQAAKLLGLSRKGLQIKMREYDLDRKQMGDL
jgi:two-component system, NtrC family, response regulator AtoC